jgi:hypothetical protein
VSGRIVISRGIAGVRRAVVGALLAVGLVLAIVVPASAAQARSLYVYGHSFTNGFGLADPALGYTRLVAHEHYDTLHSFGVNGSLVHEAAEHLYGTGHASWRSGSAGDVLIEANINTARDFGVNSLALDTSRNSLRVMLATIDASRRIEDSNHSHVYGGSWRTRRMSWVSGGRVHVAQRNGAYVQFRAVGGEYVSLRGVASAGIAIRVSDRTTGRVVARIKTGHRVHQAYSHEGIPLLYRIPKSMARHTVRLTKQSGHGTFFFDARLPQRHALAKVILVKEPYLEDYSLSSAHPHGSDAAMDAFNHVTDEVAAEFPNAFTVDLNAAGWDRTTMLQSDGVHPDEAGDRFIADAVEMALAVHRK